MKNKCKFVGIMFLCILIVCTLAVMAYEHTAGMKGAAGGASNASGNTKNTDEADDMLTVVTSFYPMYIATLNIVDGVEGVRLENLSEPQTGCLHDFQLTPEDMKLLSTADVFVINGGGICGLSPLEEILRNICTCLINYPLEITQIFTDF